MWTILNVIWLFDHIPGLNRIDAGCRNTENSSWDGAVYAGNDLIIGIGVGIL